MNVVTLTPFTIFIRALLIGLLTFGSSANAMMTLEEKTLGVELVGDGLQMHSELSQKCPKNCSSDSVIELGVCNDCLGSVILTSGIPTIDSPPVSRELMRFFETATVFLDLNLPPPK